MSERPWSRRAAAGGTRQPRPATQRRAGLVVALLAAFSATLLVPPGAGAVPDPQDPPPTTTERSAPPPEISFEELLAAEEAAALVEAEAAARRSRIPFQARSQPLQGLPAGMAALIMGGRPGGQVVSSVLAVPLGRPVEPLPPAPTVATEGDDPPGSTPAAARAEPDPPRQVVMLIVEIDGPSLLGIDPGGSARLDVFAYALEADGAVRGFFSQRLELDLAEVGEALFEGGVKLVGHLELPPGEYALRVLVHEEASQRFGLRAIPLSVPAGASLSPPLAADPAAGDAGPWLLVVESPHGAWAEVDFGELLHRAGTALPSALPVLPGDEAEVDLLVTAGSEADRFEARLLDLEDRPAATLPVALLGRRATDLPGFDRLRLRLPLDELAVGSYFLTLAGSVDGRQLTSAQLPVVVTRDDDDAVLWTDIERRLSGGEERTELALEEQSGRRRGRRNERAERAVEAAYRAVLDRLALGDHAAATADLARIEGEVLAGVANDPFGVLTVAQDRILSALEAVDPEALLPIALLHADVYRRQRQDLDFGLATRSRTQSIGVAERYAAGSSIGEAGSFASDVLATIADELQRAQVRRTARELLERATALDAENRFALLHLAAGLEKTADYTGAVAVLRRLIAVDPKAPEGRLRLAVNLLRLGQSGEAVALLDRLIAEDNPEWVLTLAYETLATVRLEGDDAAGAAELLRRAHGRLPRQDRLLIQLAYALERAGRTVEAAEAIARVGGHQAGASPRHQYNLWPEGGREELERRLAQAGRVRLPTLAAALEALPQESSR